VVATIDAICDAEDESGVSSALSAAAQAAHAAASAWHSGSGARESEASGKHATRTGQTSGALTHITADLAALNAY
jgi:hypothetical protein